MPIAAIKGLPSHAREIYESAAEATKGKTNPRTGKPYTDEERGKISWSAVKRAYKKTKDGWVAKHNALNISKNMRLSDTCSPRLLATHMLLHDWSTTGRTGWLESEIKNLHERVIKELLKRNINHKKRGCTLDEDVLEGKEPEEDEDAEIEEFELSDYDLKIFKEMAEVLTIEELKKEPMPDMPMHPNSTMKVEEPEEKKS